MKTELPKNQTTRRANHTADDLPDHWKVRIWIKGSGVMHVLSRTEPAVDANNGRVLAIEMDIITGTEHGDTIGFVCFDEVAAVSWRFCEHKDDL